MWRLRVSLTPSHEILLDYIRHGHTRGFMAATESGELRSSNRAVARPARRGCKIGGGNGT